ncbi:MAG: Ig-like domain-containing protein [Desulfuromonadaceae bacterium]|nr:Ig-like domain-containing protein [Desulfuromonadaceae bacterium]
MVNLLWSGFFTVLLLSGCGWDGTPTRNNDFTPLTSIEIVAVSPTIAVSHTIAAGTSTTLSVKGNYSGMFTRDITDQAVWSSDSPAVATASQDRVTGHVHGTAALTATVGSVSATFKLTVSPATITALTITPAAPTIAKGLSTHFAVNGTFTDLTAQDLTFDAAWTSSAPNVATVSNDAGSKGFAQAIAAGTATISATFDDVSATALLTVTEPVLKSIALSPANPTFLTLSTGSFKATGTYSDGSTPDITSLVAWSSSNTGIATVIASGGTATATTLKQGTTTISASLDGISGTTSLKTTGGNLTGITVSPAVVTLVKDTNRNITATGTFSNGSTRDITGAVQWTVADTSLATVTTPGGNLAWVKPLAVTLVPTLITATSGSLSSNASLTVIAPQLMSITISPTSLDLTAGTSAPLTVNATFSDGTIQDVTNLSVWTSNDSTKATVAAGGLGTERVTGVTAGSTTISATYGGKTVPSPAAVTVRTRTLQNLTISGSFNVAAGNQVSFTATASYGDGTTVDVTKDMSTIWTIDKLYVAILTDSQNWPGQILGVDGGSATLKVSFGGKTQTATVTVTGP